MSRFSLFLILVTLISSCSLTRSYIRKVDRTYKRHDALSHQITTDSSSLHIRTVGSGTDTLVLIHGFGPLPQAQWEEMVKGLSDQYLLVVPVLVYFEKSSSVYSEYSPNFQANQLVKGFSKLGLTHYLLAGLSYGGYIATLIADKYPEQVNGLILIDALSIFSDRSYTDSLARANGAKNGRSFLLPNSGKQLKRVFEVTYHKPPNYPAFLLNKPAQILYNDQQGHKKGLIDFLYDHEKDIKQTELSYPGNIQIIWGKEDDLIPVENAYKLQDYFKPNAQLTVLENTGHVPNMEKPKQVSEIIKQFIQNTDHKAWLKR